MLFESFLPYSIQVNCQYTRKKVYCMIEKTTHSKNGDYNFELY